MRLKNGRDWIPPSTLIAKWETAYPGINIETELAKMDLWLESNPARAKTEGGMPRFCMNWLSRSRPAPQNNTRTRSLQEDLTDRSWAL